MNNPMIQIADNYHYKLVQYEINFAGRWIWTLSYSLEIVRIDGVDNFTSQRRFCTRLLTDYKLS